MTAFKCTSISAENDRIPDNVNTLIPTNAVIQEKRELDMLLQLQNKDKLHLYKKKVSAFKFYDAKKHLIQMVWAQNHI